MDEIRKIIFAVNKTKPHAAEIAFKLSELAQRNGMSAQICDAFPIDEEAFRGKDLCCVIGGDDSFMCPSADKIRYAGVRHKSRQTWLFGDLYG